MTITVATIEQTFSEMLALAQTVVPMRNWQIQPSGKIGTTEHKSAYGYAYSNGNVEMNKLFINTSAYNGLRKVVLHEIAHLIVGLERNHNNFFKRAESALLRAANIDRDSADNELKQLVQSKVDYKYTLFANLEDGTAVEVGQVHRRTKLYSEYNPQKKCMKIAIGEHKGEKIASFTFIENK